MTGPSILRLRGLFRTAAGLALAAEEPLSVEASRTTFAMGAPTLDPGRAELSWGGQRLVAPCGGVVTETPAFLALGLREDVELQLDTRGMFRSAALGPARTQGLGALAVGAQWCFSHAGWLGTDQAVAVSHQLPGATPGLDDPRTVDAAALLTSGTYGATHVDLNLVHAWLGRTQVPGQGRAVRGRPRGGPPLGHDLDLDGDGLCPGPRGWPRHDHVDPLEPGPQARLPPDVGYGLGGWPNSTVVVGSL